MSAVELANAYAGQRVLVLGAARSGAAALELLQRAGARVCVYDRDRAALARLPDPVERATGAHPPAFAPFDFVVTSPGFALEPEARVMSEIDLAARHVDTRWIGVTGTNGKSTTTVMIHEMLRAQGLASEAAGNVGRPLCSLAGRTLDWCVVELSSFQLEHTREIPLEIAVVLNLSPDHLDRYGSLDAYARAKARIVELQNAGSSLVVNCEDDFARGLATRARGLVLGFSTSEALQGGSYCDGEDVVFALEGGVVLRVARSELAPAARSPLENALAAIAAAATAGAGGSAISRALAEFPGLPHRAREVCTRRGVRYVNDSKATNPAAAASTLRALDAPIWWLAGGRNKGADLGILADAARRVRGAFVFGEAAGELLRALTPALRVQGVDSLEDALAAAASNAEPGDVVLLAPACSSLDQFSSFEERGDRFATLARGLSC